MVASTLLVEQDLSGTAFGGTFVPTDVTRFVRLIDGVSINSWRQDAASQISPATLSLTFDNDAIPGDATAPNAGRFTPGLSTSPWTGKILPGVRTRITETVGGTAYQLFEGYVLDWTAQPGGDDGTFPVVQVSCTDALGWMAQLQPLYSIVVEEMLLDAPLALYPLDEAAGSTSAGDVTGKAPAAVVTNSKYGAGTLAFGTSGAIVGQPQMAGFTSPDVDSLTLAARATYLVVPNSALPATAPWSFVFAWQGDAYTVQHDEWIFTIPGQDSVSTFQVDIEIETNSLLRATVIGFNGLPVQATGTVGVLDGSLHVGAVTLAADGKTLSVYVDGALYAQHVGIVDTQWTRRPGVQGYVGVSMQGGIRSPLRADLALLGIYGTELSAARAGAHYNAAKTAFAGERTDVHAARLMTYRPNTGAVLDVGKGTVGAHVTTGLSMTQALLDTAKAEGGLVFADGQGRIVMLNRARLYDAAVAATYDSEADLTSDYQARIDTQLVVNDMTVSRPAGADQRVISAASKATYGWRQQSDTYIVNSDRDADDAAGWLVANQKSASVRTPSIAIDVTTMTSTPQAQAAMARQPLDRVALSNLPAWAPPTDVVVQGRTVRIDDKGLSLSFFTSPVARKTLRADAAPSANTKLDSGLVIPW